MRERGRGRWSGTWRRISTCSIIENSIVLKHLEREFKRMRTRGRRRSRNSRGRRRHTPVAVVVGAQSTSSSFGCLLAPSAEEHRGSPRWSSHKDRKSCTLEIRERITQKCSETCLVCCREWDSATLACVIQSLIPPITSFWMKGRNGSIPTRKHNKFCVLSFHNKKRGWREGREGECEIRLINTTGESQLLNSEGRRRRRRNFWGRRGKTERWSGRGRRKRHDTKRRERHRHRQTEWRVEKEKKAQVF